MGTRRRRFGLTFGLLTVAAFGTVARAATVPGAATPGLGIVGADGGVALTVTSIAVRTPTTTATATVDAGDGRAGSAELATDDPSLGVRIDVASTGLGTTTLDIAATGPGAADVTAVVVEFAATPDERFFGLGERAGSVDHRGERVVNRVADGPWTEVQLGVIEQLLPPPGFSDRADATYFPVPWVLSTAGYGVLVGNHETSTFDLAGDSAPEAWSIGVEASAVDLTVFTGTAPAATLARMTETVGRQPAPPAPWIFGPWYQVADNEQAELAALAAAAVPMSVIQTYTHYLPCGDQAGREAEERDRTDRLHDLGLAVTTYVNPMVCVSYGDVYRLGSLTGAFTTTADGLPYRYRYFTTEFFDVVQFDFTSPAGVELFHDVLDDVVEAGYDGWMEDFGEYTPDDAVSADGTPGPVMHNRYAELYHDAGMAFVESAARPLVRFNRSGWTGAIDSSQVVWGGDPTTSWGFDGLRSSVTSGLGMGLSGVGVWGSDIGGFFTFDEGEQLTPELLVRWIEFGTFSPVMRLQAGGVSLVDAQRPTVFDDDVAGVWRSYSQLRTSLYPYIAGSHDAYVVSGLPLMRHLALVAPDDPQAVDVDDAYLFGADLLVAPVVEPGATSRAVYLPEGDWVEWWPTVAVAEDGSPSLRAARVHDGGDDYTVDAPLGSIPLFVRSGAVIPLLPADVATLAGYGGPGVVRLADRSDQRTLLVFAGGAWTGPLGPGETMTASRSGDTWTLRFDALQARTYTVEAALEGLGDGFTPCGVTADGAAVDFAWDGSTLVLSATIDVGAAGELGIRACS